MLAAGHEAHAEAGFIQHHNGEHQQYQTHKQEHIDGDGADVEDEVAVDEGQLGGLGTGAAGHGVVVALHQNQSQRRGQQVQGGAADGLIRLQVDGGEGQQRRIGHTGQGCGADADEHLHERGGFRRQHDQHQQAKDAADDHDAFHGDVDDAGVLGEAGAQGHQHQDDAVNQRIFDQKRHFAFPSFAFLPPLIQLRTLPLNRLEKAHR